MKQYVGLDVSLKETSVCVMNELGKIDFRGKVLSQPAAIAALVRERAHNAVCVVLETGPLSTWHWHSLRQLNVPVVCADARHARAVLSCRVNKTDDNDAEGLAHLGRTGWYREVGVKSMGSHHARSLLAARSQLVKVRRDLENQVRGLLRTFGLLAGKGSGTRFQTRVRELLAEVPALGDVIEPLLEVLSAVRGRLATLDRRVLELARASRACRILMRCPGVGPLTALAYAAAVDDPRRFSKSSSVGAYFGLTSRRHQSGEVDWGGRISKCGDATVRSLLYQAANVHLTRVKRWCPLKAWGTRLSAKIGAKKARVAVARKLAVILHRMWLDDAEFHWSKTNKEATA